MTTIRAFIKRHAVLTYFVLTFVISWGATLLVIGGPGRIPATPEEIPRLFPAVYLATVAGPSLAAILLTGLVGGRAFANWCHGCSGGGSAFAGTGSRYWPPRYQ